MASWALGGFEIRRGSLSGGAARSSGGDFDVRNTTSQPDAGETAGAGFQVAGSIAQGDPADCVALTAASGITASSTFCAGVRVSWLDNSTHEAGYRVKRDGVPIGVTGPDVTVYDDSTAAPGIPYTYTVMTMNNCGDANPSPMAIGHRAVNPVAPSGVRVAAVWKFPDSTVVDLTWNDNAADEVLQIVSSSDSTASVLGTLPPNVETARFTIPYKGVRSYCFTVTAVNCDVKAVSEASCSVITGVGVDEGNGAPPPTVFALGRLAPNPFNPVVRIAFDVPRAAPTAIRVYDVTGRLVRTLHDAVTYPGRHLLYWDGRDAARRPSAGGVYFVEMRAPGFRKVGKVTLLK